MSGVQGNIGNLWDLRKKIEGLPISVKHEVARRAKDALNADALAAFVSGKTIYGEARPTSKALKPRGRYSYGQSLSLVATGKTLATLKFVAIGTIVRCSLGTPYSKYLIGKYRILPSGRQALPYTWSQHLIAIVNRYCTEAMQA